MCDVCKVDRLQADTAERMSVALLSSHPEFVRLPSGHWALVASPATRAGESAVVDRRDDRSEVHSFPTRRSSDHRKSVV